MKEMPWEKQRWGALVAQLWQETFVLPYYLVILALKKLQHKNRKTYKCPTNNFSNAKDIVTYVNLISLFDLSYSTLEQVCVANFIEAIV